MPKNRRQPPQLQQFRKQFARHFMPSSYDTAAIATDRNHNDRQLASLVGRQADAAA
jgi:hypothetical protein